MGTRGKGTQGIVKRFRVKRLQRCSHRGVRKIGCIGAWHPSAVKWTVGRRGQLGYHSRTELKKKISPLGGFPHYGEVNEDFVLIKGGIIGTRKRPIVLRKSIFACTRAWMTEQVDVKFIDTSSKHGHGRF